MGCDSEYGWDSAADDYRLSWKERGYQINSLGDPYDCLLCGSKVKRDMVDVHDAFHELIEQMCTNLRMTTELLQAMVR